MSHGTQGHVSHLNFLGRSESARRNQIPSAISSVQRQQHIFHGNVLDRSFAGYTAKLTEGSELWRIFWRINQHFINPVSEPLHDDDIEQSGTTVFLNCRSRCMEGGRVSGFIAGC